MRLTLPAIFVAASLGSVPAAGFTEGRRIAAPQPNKGVTIKEVTMKGEELTLTAPYIIDTRSTLRVDFSRPELLTALGRAGGGQQADAIIKDLKILKEAVQKGQDALPKLGIALAAVVENPAAPLPPDVFVAAQGVVQSAQAGRARLAGRLQAALLPQPLPQGLNAQEQQVASIMSLYKRIFEAANQETAELEKELNTLLAADNYTLRAELTIDRHPVPQDAPSSGILSLTPAQVAELNELGRFALANQGRRPEEILGELLKAQVNPVKDRLASDIQAHVNTLKNQADALITQLGANAQVAPIVAQVRSIIANLDQVSVAVNQLRQATSPSATSEAEAGTFLSGISGNVNLIGSLVGSLSGLVTALEQQIQAANPPQILMQAATQFKDLLKHTQQKMITSLGMAATQLPFIGDILRAVGGVNATFERIANEVQTTDLATLNPISFPLEGRVLGRDKVTLSVRALRQGETNANAGVVLYPEVAVRPYNVEYHVRQTPLLIFAQPSGTGDFKPGASYSFLFRRGSRRSFEQNEFFNMGFGGNLAALTFTGGSNVELGAGGVLSFWDDRVQAGYGYNVNAKKGYLFFGLRLPLPGSR